MKSPISPKKRQATDRDPEATKRIILKAATAEFASKGLGGARVDEIAEAAGVNKRMLYYYFDHKDGLFQAVLEATYESIRSAETKLSLGEVDSIEAVRRLIAFTWTYYLEHPEFLSLLNTANLHEARHLKQSTKVRTLHSPFVAMIDSVLRRGVKEGVFRNGVDPVQLYISIAGLSYFYISNQHTLGTIFDRKLLKPKARLERLSHMNDLVLGYLVR
ncbi:MAG: TetR/AcrR family transcriptional regulator [Burkholderiaceae bacterium]